MEVKGEKVLSGQKSSETLMDLYQRKPGFLLYGRHKTWEAGKSGIVIAVAENRLAVQYFPGIGNVTNHFFIPVSEAENKEWEIRWTYDLSEVFTYNLPAGEKVETEVGDESEGADL